MDEEQSEEPAPDPWQAQREALGGFIRTQRKLANMSLRELADLTKVSNPYLSQVERGLHAPSVRVLQSISRALNLSADMVLAQAGLSNEEEGDETASPTPTEQAIRTDSRLTDEQKATLLAVYRSYVGPGASP